MRSRFIRPFFNFHDPFFSRSMFSDPFFFNVRRFQPRRIIYQNQVQQNNSNDPHEIFKKFFEQNGLKSQQEKNFFKKHYSQQVESEKPKAFKVLGLQENASQEQINQAFRTLSMKYHPKNDASQEATQKFKEVCQAYQQVKNNQNQSRDLGQLNPFDKIFQGFNKQFQSFFNFKGDQKQLNNQSNSQSKKSPDYKHYSESSYEQIKDNGKKRLIQKTYNKDGKILKVKREQTMKQDGTKQIKETIDDGKDVKTKVFNETKTQKEIA